MTPTASLTKLRPKRPSCAPLALGYLLVLAACGPKSAAAPATPEASASAAPVANVGEAALPSAASGSALSTASVAAAPASPRALPAFCAGAESAPPPSPASRATPIREGFVFVEGPVWSDQLGAFLFSEMDFEHQGRNGPPSKIHKLVLPSSIEVFITDSGSNGLAVDEQGLVACTHDTQTLSRFDLGSKARRVFAADFQGKHFNSPNDVALHSRGHAYFTDPDWQLGERKNETGVTGVYWRKPSGEVVLLDGALERPNGITLSPDETHLYVGSVAGVVHVYDVLADGSVGPRRAFAKVEEPDGMAIDCAGRLFVASHSAGEVVVLSPEGEAIGAITVAPRATNVAFGGPDHRTILITAGSGVYSLRSATPGLPY